MRSSSVRRFLVCGRLDGREEVLERLVVAAHARRPDLLLFCGGVLDPAARSLDRSPGTERLRRDRVLLERFFHTLGQLKTRAAVIPGAADAPLREFLRVGMNAEVEFPGAHVVHDVLLEEGDVAVAGVGGDLTAAEDSLEAAVRHSRVLADYFLRELRDARQSLKVLLLAVPPTGRLGGAAGSAIATELIDSHHPFLCVVGGPEATRGWERAARTLIVNPGELSAGSAAWVDLTRGTEEQVELIRI
ncbi:MAG TPA: hypothetical protein VGQ83_04140 [Polyangia bacterium]|jgi:Icc-related predicted phosphoesterase